MKITTYFCRGLLLACFWVGELSAQQYSTGCVLDAKLYEKAPLAFPLERGDYDNVPAAKSLRLYAPTPQNQGTYGTCVGWATAYSALTIQMAQKIGWTNSKIITENAFSPFFVYESAKSPSDIHCQEGTSLFNGLSILKEVGVVKNFDYPDRCGLSITKALEKKAQQYKIKEYRRLFDRNVEDKMPFIKKSIAENRPVVVGIQCCIGSFQNAKKQKFWKATGTEINEKPDGGHALTVIGYDDMHEGGGAVELMNSWGEEWGDGGFIWVSYKDFNKFCFEAYDMIIQEENHNALEGTLSLELSAGESVPFYLKNGVYETKNSYQSGTMFRLALSNHEPMFVYILGSDLQSQDYKIFPANANISTLLPHNNTTIMFPAAPKYIELDKNVGTDYICVLYATEKIDMDIMEALKEKQGDLPERIKEVFGERLLSPQEIDRSTKKDEIYFKSTHKFRDIAAIFVAIQHID